MFAINATGTSYRNRQIMNCQVTVIRGYYDAAKRQEELYAVGLQVTLPEAKTSKVVLLQLSDLRIQKIVEQVPMVWCSNGSLCNRYLQEVAARFYADAKCAEDGGVLQPYFMAPGIYQLPNTSYCAVEGRQVIGVEQNACCLSPGVQKYMISDRVDMPIYQLVKMLLQLPPEVTLTVVYSMFTLVQSLIREVVDVQGVLFISGPSGFGKTTLAKRACGFVQNSDSPQHEPALFFDAGSTWASIRDAMVSARDLPLIIDDLCLSAGSTNQKRRTEMAAKAIRAGANVSTIMKKSQNGEQVEMRCNAGIILTAEFSLDSISDLTRCILVPIQEKLDLPDKFSADLVGGAALEFVRYFLEDVEGHLEDLQQFLIRRKNDFVDDCQEGRVRKNLIILKWIAEQFVKTIGEAEDELLSKQFLSKVNLACQNSIAEMNRELQEIHSSVPRGNLAYVLYDGYMKNCFNLAKEKNLQKLFKKDGALYRGDLCLRSQALESYVRRQPGYHKISLNKIVQELMDLGVLCIQEEGTRQVKIKKDLPRVYRIRLDKLEEAVEQY